MQDYRTIEHSEVIPIDEFIKKLTRTYLTFRDLKESKDFCKLKYAELLQKFQNSDEGINDIQLLDADEFLEKLNQRFGTTNFYDAFKKEYGEYERYLKGDVIESHSDEDL